MKYYRFNFLLITLIVLSMFFGVSCSSNDSAADSENAGTMSISIYDGISRTIVPDISMEPTTYNVSGVGPDGASFDETTESTTLTIGSLVFGEWTVTVTAYNSAGDAIGDGTGSVTIATTDTTSVSVDVVPFDGTGTLNLSLEWNGTVTSIEAGLVPSSGDTRELDFTISDSTASFSASDVDTGYHTLIVKLFNGDTLVKGKAEIVRIVKDQTTQGTLSLGDLNAGYGSIEVNILQDMQNPLEVDIDGGAATKYKDQTFSLTAQVTDYTENVSWYWYINGVSAGSGASFDFDSSYDVGYYNIDLIGLSADGNRAGSAALSVEVIEDDAVIMDDLYGSYWGTMTVMGTDYDMCLDIRAGSISFYSSVMSTEYTNIAYTEENGTWSFAAYADEDTGQTGDALCTGIFTVADTVKTCIATIAAMGATTNTLTLGNDYNGEYDEEEITMDDLYGAYWGTMDVMGTPFEMCLDVRAESITLLSTAMSFLYANVVFTQDADDGTWSFAAYYESDTEHSSPKVTGTFSVDGSIKTCIAEVIPMSTTTNTLTLGDDYNGEYGDVPTDPM